ncbi:AAA family ATPase [Methylobacterium sp. JK268]
MREKNFADKYRPEVFSEVFVQESAVTCLANLIRFGQLGRSILLHGSSGSGKTALAQIYARALNCENPAPDGSPCCKHCEPCRGFVEDEITYFDTYNVAARGGELAQIRQWVHERNREERVFRYRILFFDEAHALTPSACDMLLDAVERPAKGVLFFFATTEMERLRPALRSRLLDVLVRPLSVPMAVAFLRRIAKKAEIDYEPGALELLAGLRNGYPRDLLFGLERVYDGKRPYVKVEQVREAFDADQTDALVAYFEALGEGRLDRQTAVLGDWREAGSDKVRWIQGFLVSLYHNDILHRRLLLDGLIDAIPESTRRSIVDQFLQRLGLARPAELAPIWCAMMDFWVGGEPARDDTALALRLTLFHQLVNGNAASADAIGRKLTPPLPATDAASMAAAHQGFAPLAPSLASLRGETGEPGFLTAQEARWIVNAASFLVQEHAVFFNAAFEIRPECAGARPQAEAIRLIRAFRNDLDARAEAGGGTVFASITLVERDAALGVVGHLVAHVIMPEPDSSGGPNGLATGLPGLDAWARGWCGPHPAARGVVLPRMAPAGETTALAFHWDVALALCGGLSDRLEVWDCTREQYRPLCALLGVRARSSGPVYDVARVSVSEKLSDTAIARACEYRLAPLSAFDDGAFAEIRTGWETSERADRVERRLKRTAEIEKIRLRYRDNPDATQAAIETVMRTWSPDPHSRVRSWRGWWA